MISAKILVVEDEFIVANDLVVRLTELGYKVVGQADNGPAAIEMVGTTKPDLVLMDIRLKGHMDGIAAATAIREQYELPSVFLTAYAEDSTIERAHIAEPYGYVLKPCENRELRTVIEIALHKHKAEAEIRRLNRLYHALSQINQTLVRVRSRDEMFQTICKITADLTRLKLVWVGWVDAVTCEVIPVASAGDGKDYLSHIKVYADDRPEGRGVIGPCIREGKPFIINNFADAPQILPWRGVLDAFGLRAIAAFPIRFKGQVCGTFTVYADEPNVFRDKEIALLEEAATDISFSLDHLDQEDQRRRSESALRESELRLNLALNGARMELWDHDLTSGKLVWSPGLEALWGYAPGEFPGTYAGFEKRVHPEDVHAIRQGSSRALQKREPFQQEYRVVWPDGNVHWVASHGRHFFNADGKPNRLVGVIYDITPRKLMEESLRQSERRFREVVEAAPDAIFIQTGGCFAYVNPMAVKLFGARNQELLIGHPVIEHFHDQNRVQVVERIRRVNQERKPVPPLEEVIIRDDGSFADVEVSAVPFEYQGQRGALVFMRDVRERKMTESQLRKLSQAVEQSPVSIVITDPSGSIEYVNPNFTQVTGYSLEEVLGKNPRILKGDKTQPSEYEQLWKTIIQGRGWRGEFHNRKKNGEYYWEYASISPILDREGKILHFLAVKEDITHRRSLEEQLRQSQKLESVGQLAGGVAHDFNNILAAIMMHLSFLQSNADLDNETRESLGDLMTEAKRDANLTRQLLMFSRRSVMEIKTLDLNEVVANMLKMLGRLIGEHITVTFERREGVPQVEADAGMIEQVLMNLAVNARDAMPNGGRLTICVDQAHLDKQEGGATCDIVPGLFVCISVSDTGDGMDEATRRHIFEPFFTTKEAGKGTGLGLATVHGIVAQHKGFIQVESVVGKGTTFRICLPASNTPMSRIIEQKKAPPQRGSETILVVEDELNVRRAVIQGLRMLGYTLFEASNGQEAMKVWQEHHAEIDLLFSDMVMPEGISGMDLMQKFRETKPALKVILSSGYSSETVGAAKSMGQGIMFLPKPYQIEVLAKIVRDCLS